jgi:hypothetical protein
MMSAAGQLSALGANMTTGFGEWLVIRSRIYNDRAASTEGCEPGQELAPRRQARHHDRADRMVLQPVQAGCTSRPDGWPRSVLILKPMTFA